jgi:hypothetical protein
MSQLGRIQVNFERVKQVSNVPSSPQQREISSIKMFVAKLKEVRFAQDAENVASSLSVQQTVGVTQCDRLQPETDSAETVALDAAFVLSRANRTAPKMVNVRNNHHLLFKRISRRIDW